MKTIKTLVVLSAFLITGISKVQATDRCVAESGSGGCFATITDAMNAASNGDRIIINPKAGGVPYLENLTITKSLQFLSNNQDTMFAYQGTITITPSSGMAVTFIGMYNIMGGITTSGAGAGTRCKVTIMNSRFASGSIDLNNNNYDLEMISTVVNNGYVAFRYGRLIGNDITTMNTGYYLSWAVWPWYAYATVYIENDATASNDSIVVIGNKITNQYSSTYTLQLANNSSSQFLNIMNNYISESNGQYGGMIYFYTAKNSSAGKNTISNNTLSSSVIFNAIYLNNIPALALIDVENNVAIEPSTSSLFTGANLGGAINLSFNYCPTGVTINIIPDNGTNKTNSNTTINANGKNMAGSDAINGGAPDQSYYDIDLTRNDAGAYGGSFTLDNYFPIMGATRVFMVKAPRKVVLGNSINVQAESFDR